MLKKEQKVTLSDGTEVIVYELDAAQIGTALLLLEGVVNALFANAGQTDAVLTMSVAKLVARNWNTVLSLLQESCSLGEKVAELGGTETIKVAQAFGEVNTSFFVELSGLLTTKSPTKAEAMDLLAQSEPKSDTNESEKA